MCRSLEWLSVPRVVYDMSIPRVVFDVSVPRCGL